MKVRGAKNNSGSQQSQGVNPGQQAAESAGGSGAQLRQEFQGLLATFAGRVKDPNSSISLETFQVEALQPETEVAAVEKPSEPTAIQTATQASVMAAPVKQELKNEAPAKQDEAEVVATDAAAPAAACSVTAAPKQNSNPEQAATAQSTLSAEEVSQELSAEQAVEAPATETAAAVKVSDQGTEENYAQPQDQASLSKTQSSEEIAASAAEVAPEQAQDAAVEPVAAQSTEAVKTAQPVDSAQGAHPVSQPKATEPHAEIKHSAAAAPSTTVAPAVSAAPSSNEESADQDVTEQLPHLLSNFLQSFAPAEIAPKDSAQNNPAISVLSQLIRQGLASEILSSAQKANESVTQNAAAERSASAAQSGNNALAGIGATSSGRAATSETRSVRPLPAAAATRILERVEQTLKEVSRSKNGKSISLTLTPDDLGTVKVDVTLKQGTLHARLGAESAQVSQLLRERAPELQAMLRKLGLNVDKVSVSVHSEGQNFSQMHDQLERHSSQQRNQGGGNSFGSSAAGSALPVAAMAQEQNAKLDHWVA